jgi:hypothetical protein
MSCTVIGSCMMVDLQFPDLKTGAICSSNFIFSKQNVKPLNQDIIDAIFELGTCIGICRAYMLILCFCSIYM